MEKQKSKIAWIFKCMQSIFGFGLRLEFSSISRVVYVEIHIYSVHTIHQSIYSGVFVASKSTWQFVLVAIDHSAVGRWKLDIFQAIRCGSNLFFLVLCCGIFGPFGSSSSCNVQMEGTGRMEKPKKYANQNILGLPVLIILYASFSFIHVYR